MKIQPVDLDALFTEYRPCFNDIPVDIGVIDDALDIPEDQCFAKLELEFDNDQVSPSQLQHENDLDTCIPYKQNSMYAKPLPSLDKQIEFTEEMNVNFTKNSLKCQKVDDIEKVSFPTRQEH